MKDLAERTLAEKTVFEGKVFRVKLREVELPDGRKSRRDLVEHLGGACVLALNDQNQVYLVKQFRAAFGKLLLELPAGKLEAGEESLTCARRELTEETGLTASSWQLLSKIYPSPGYLDEVISIYLARGLDQGQQQLDPGEFLSVELIDLSTALEMVKDGEIKDAKTVAGLLLAQHVLAKEEHCELG